MTDAANRARPDAFEADETLSCMGPSCPSVAAGRLPTMGVQPQAEGVLQRCSNAAWRLLARALAGSPGLRLALLRRAFRVPYTHITSADGREVYMERYWLANPYGRTADGEQGPARWRWLPSVRMHWIMREDLDRHLHDHPWNARTLVLWGWYKEQRIEGEAIRSAGYTGRLLFGQYHRITEVSPGGVMTLFITWRKRGTWGFLVDGHKVPWRQYLADEAARAARLGQPLAKQLDVPKGPAGGAL